MPCARLNTKALSPSGTGSFSRPRGLTIAVASPRLFPEPCLLKNSLERCDHFLFSCHLTVAKETISIANCLLCQMHERNSQRLSMKRLFAASAKTCVLSRASPSGSAFFVAGQRPFFSCSLLEDGVAKALSTSCSPGGGDRTPPPPSPQPGAGTPCVSLQTPSEDGVLQKPHCPGQRGAEVAPSKGSPETTQRLCSQHAEAVYSPTRAGFFLEGPQEANPVIESLLDF